MKPEFFLGIDIGSSSIKVALVEKHSGKCISQTNEPKDEMSMLSLKKGWAEQNPEDWWKHTCTAIQNILQKNNIDPEQIVGLGIAYQMHGLVLVDKEGLILRNSIIWCDSRAVKIGDKAYNQLGEAFCDEHLLNSPGNFTASKLRWVKENEPAIFEKIHKVMLPGDYIAYRFTGDIATTVSGLSEGIFWDFKNEEISKDILEFFGLDIEIIPNIVDSFGLQGRISKKGAEESGLKSGTPVLYRAGDQPNNALSLDVFHPGEIAATAGTSGVVYAIADNVTVNETSRINNFAHVNHQKAKKRIGKLLCINGAGIQYRWLRNNLSVSSYQEMNHLAAEVEVGSEGVSLIPFGNGAERMLDNKIVDSRILGLDLNRHSKNHICRAALEGIAFAFAYGMEILEKEGVDATVLKAGNDNLFQADIFGKTIATLLNKEIQIYNTSGAIGAARACILESSSHDNFSSFLKSDHIRTISSEKNLSNYQLAYEKWKTELESTINK